MDRDHEGRTLPDCQRPGREERAKRFLEEYRLCASLIRAARAAEEGDDPGEDDPGTWNERAELSLWRAKCRAVSALIASIEPSREKLVLTLRYLKGIPLERAAGLMDLSRRTAYRIHCNALRIVARKLSL